VPVDPSVYVTRAELAAMQATFGATMSELRSALSSLGEAIDDFKPLLLARSGDMRDMENMRRDIAISHDKHRSHYAEHQALERRIVEERETTDERIIRVERRVDKAQWMLIGAISLLQLIFLVFGPAAQAWLKAAMGVG
jgi:chromosome segregation ATPase